MERGRLLTPKADNRHFLRGDGTVDCPRQEDPVAFHRCYFCSGAMEITPPVGSEPGWVRCTYEEPG